ncbi:hypothetical protein [Hanstruepera marina]|uniref:hypothetical protein n=1 Tax=Hanstruepera marina TaxID=2873265 RepID=UPI001CA68451|nr:hypothetical protein [Hanstruepera marina]
MKKLALLFVCCFITLLGFSQTDGISYQAVIIDNNPQEIPGVDIPSNNLPNVPLQVQFSIIDNNGSVEYQEIHSTTTDAYGMIHLMIGQGQTVINSFNQIYWNNEKYLKVEIDLNDGNGWVGFSYQELTYIPYVKHREIIATSTLDVDGATNLNNSFSVNNASPSHLTGDLTVDGNTNLNGALTVFNQEPTLLTGDLTVEGTANFSDGVFDNITVNQHAALNTVTADGVVNFNSDFYVNNQSPTDLSGNLTVDGESEFFNRVKIDVSLAETDIDDYDAYPLQIEGSQQGIAIKLAPNSPNRNNNYISFWDGDNTIRGRIEANEGLVSISTDIIWDLITIPDFGDVIDADPDDTPPDVEPNQYFNNNYAFGAYSLTLELVSHIIRFGINVTAALGFCATGDCDDVVWSFMDVVVAGIQLGGYITYNEINIGVAYESGGADYAEWLRKYNTNEVLSFGDVVGVKAGMISKSFADADKFMVISQNPMISAAMPEKGNEKDYEKVAFIGQVPVKVLGKASVGDYIVSTGNADGFAIAISPDQMNINDYKRIVGVAWAESIGDNVFSYVQTAIGINANDLTFQIEKMQVIMNMMQESLAKLDSGFKPQLFDVESEIQPKEESKPATIQERIAEKTTSKNYTSLKEAIQQIEKDYIKQSGFDIMKLPYLQEVIDNPSRENAEKLVDYYNRVLVKLQKMNPSKF